MNKPDFAQDKTHQLENGIFSFVIQMCKQIELSTHDIKLARETVAEYLESLATGLREIDNEQEEHQ